MHMKKWICYLFFVSSVIACEEQEPTLTMPQEKLIPILVDVHLAEGATYNVLKEQKDSLLKIYYKQIFEIHEVSEELFNENIAILQQNPSLTVQVYKIVQEEVKAKQSK